MTGEELYKKTAEEQPDVFWHPWDNISDDERAGWERKAAEDKPKKPAAEKPEGKKGA